MIDDSLKAKIRRDVDTLAIPRYSTTDIALRRLAIPASSKRIGLAQTRTVLFAILAALVLAFPLGAFATHAASLKDFIRATFASVGFHGEHKAILLTSISLSLPKLRAAAPFAVIVPNYLPKPMHFVRSFFASGGRHTTAQLIFSAGSNRELNLQEARIGSVKPFKGGSFVTIHFAVNPDGSSNRDAQPSVENVRPAIWQAGQTQIIVFSDAGLSANELDHVRRSMGARVLVKPGKTETIAPKRDRP